MVAICALSSVSHSFATEDKSMADAPPAAGTVFDRRIGSCNPTYIHIRCMCRCNACYTKGSNKRQEEKETIKRENNSVGLHQRGIQTDPYYIDIIQMPFTYTGMQRDAYQTKPWHAETQSVKGGPKKGRQAVQHGCGKVR